MSDQTKEGFTVTQINPADAEGEKFISSLLDFLRDDVVWSHGPAGECFCEAALSGDCNPDDDDDDDDDTIILADGGYTAIVGEEVFDLIHPAKVKYDDDGLTIVKLTMSSYPHTTVTDGVMTMKLHGRRVVVE